MSAALAIGTRVYDGARILWGAPIAVRFRGGFLAIAATLLLASLVSWNPADPSLNAAASVAPTNWMGSNGAVFADLLYQSLGVAAWPAVLLMLAFGLSAALGEVVQTRLRPTPLKALAAVLGVLLLAGALAALVIPAIWPLAAGLGGLWGDALLWAPTSLFGFAGIPFAAPFAGVLLAIAAVTLLAWTLGLRWRDLTEVRVARPVPKGVRKARAAPKAAAPNAANVRPRAVAPEPEIDDDPAEPSPPWEEPTPAPRAPKVAGVKAPRPSGREQNEMQGAFEFARTEGFELPPLGFLSKPKTRVAAVDEESLKQNAQMLESVLAEFGVKGVIDQIRPGPVVTLYELAPAPGVKHARVVGLSDDIARSMSARACRVSVVQGRNAIGIELPNAKRETVYLRDLLASTEYAKPGHLLPLALGETIGGEPYVADLARMPHLLIAGTTGSGKSVGVNAMILSILYRLSPEQCRFIMIDPKMLELSVYDGIPHLLTPVVTDPKKAVVALKWTVREMEDRYRRMSKLGVRNIASYNERAREALAKGEHFERTVQTGFDDQGRPVYESEKIRPEHMPYLVVVMDEMADLMLVAGKDVEGAVQRLAQMARAAGIHLIMATQRPSVDVITGTIKANFPTRISFQVTSKIDSRTILGEQGGEQLLGQGDMLYMAGGGRITRLHGPFVTDQEVEQVAQHLREQAEPEYLDLITEGGDEDESSGEFGGNSSSGDDLYDRAVAVVTRDRKASTSYIQRRLQIGYNRAASLIEKMEQEGVVSPANHAGKRDILAGPPPV
ncbi:DNA translocase FtsK 4TM domain-containing protein [Brevundimonas sp.]|uniref:FtsK/SpoIIIE family DNA translocase n=1 Tax=Brevundimonas sp. TaxID=1871086 RepID=UPI00391AECBE